MKRDVLAIMHFGTWCRHSFATNLTHAGVDRKYITESMGHSTSHSITDMYIAAYPLDTQFEYNSRLLNLGKKKDTTPTKDRIEKMTEQEAKGTAAETARYKIASPPQDACRSI